MIRRFGCLALFLITFAFPAFAQIQLEKVRDHSTIKIQALNLEIQLPKGWHEIESGADWHVLGAYSPVAEPEITDPLLIVYVMPILNDASLEAIVFSTAVKKANRLGEKSLVTVGGREEKEVAGQTALKYRYSHRLNNKNVIAEYTIFEKGELAFLISAWIPENAAESVLQEIENFSLKGVRFSDPGAEIHPDLLAEMKEEDLKNAQAAQGGQASGLPADLDALVDKMEQRLEEQPEAQGYVALGIAYERMGKYPEAEKAYEKAIEIDPQQPDGYAALGVFYGNAGDVLAAKNYFEKAQALDPSNDELMNNLASAYVLLKEYDKGIEYYKAALQIKPDDLMRRARLGQAYFLSGRQDEAIHEFEEVLKKDPSIKPVRHQLIQIYSQTGNDEKAREHLTIFQET